MKRANSKLLTLVFYLLLYSLAFANDILISPLNTPYGMKIYLDNLTSEYNLSYKDGIITLIFDDEIKFKDPTNLNKSFELINKIIVQDKSLNIFLNNKNLKVEKFQEKSKVGINVFDLTLDQNQIKSESTDSFVNVTFKQEPNNIKIIFQWREEVGNVVYIRNDKLWVVFDKFTKLKINDFPTNQKAYQVELNSLATFFSLDMSDIANDFSKVLAYKEDKKWIIEINNKSAKPHALKVFPKPYSLPGPRVEVKFDTSVKDPIHFIDPDIGDNLIVVTSDSGGFALNENYKFIDFKALKTFQGLLIKPLIDNLNISNNYQFLYINSSKDKLLNISSKNSSISDTVDDTGTNNSIKDNSNNRSIISLNKYQINDGTFLAKLIEIQKAIISATSINERNKIYNKLALFYLANDFYEEASLALQLLKQEDLDFKNDYKIKLIESAIRFKKGDYLEAYKLVNTIDITDVPIFQRKEVRFWQTIISYMLINTEDFLNKLDPLVFFLNDNNTFMVDYTDSFKFSFGAALINHKMKNREFESVQTIIDKLDKLELSKHKLNQLFLIKANFYSQKNQDDKAIEKWDECLKDWQDNFNYSQCKFRKAKFMYESDKLSLDDYLKTIEDITWLWRGDDLEVEVLKELGQTYFDNKNYINALRSWKKITDYYPFSPNALNLASQIGQTYINFFTKGIDSEVSHLQASAIFYEFENLIPIGEIGDEVVIKFTDHLIALDLLQRAENLLNHQILYRLHGYKRERIINKLAEVYILDQHPELAIDVINLAGPMEELPEEIAKERKYILATAYYKNEESDNALAILGDDITSRSDEIKSEIYWERRDWKNFNLHVEPRIYEIRQDFQELNPEDSLKVLKLAISYLILNEQELTKALFKDFIGRMPKNNINTDLLNSLSETWNVVNNNHIDALKDLVTIEKKVNELITLLNNTKK